MPSTPVLLELAIIVFSFISGIIVYYVIATNTKATKKKLMEDVISLTINFVIYIWLGKIIINLPKFIKDPLSILAYPSNSYAVYVATLFIVINLLYRKYRHHQDVAAIIYAFIPVFLSASFMFEFLQVVVERHTYNTSYLIFMAVLSIGYMIVAGKLSLPKQSFIFGISLFIGQLLLIVINKITIFGYRLSPFYFGILLIVVIIVMFIDKRKV